jgi:hypothetical protein
VRFQELRDADGTVIARGLHPAIAVVAAGAVARAAAISAVVSTQGCIILHPSDVENELKRAAIAAVEQHENARDHKQAKVADAQFALQQAVDAGLRTSRETSTASNDLVRFDELATRLGTAEEDYEVAVRADAEAARAVATALGELDHILGQRHSASTSLDQARKAADGHGVPEAVVHQAMNLQAALAAAEAEKRQVVQQADEIAQVTRVASRDALLAREAAHSALRSGMSLISVGAPNWGPGMPLPGLLSNYRDSLANRLAAAEAAEAEAKNAEQAARSFLEQEGRDLDLLAANGPGEVDARATIAAWVSSEHFSRDDAVFADEAFGRFGAEGTAALLSNLAGRGCQVIYLTDDPELLGWAIGLPHEAGGASTISTSRTRKPALVSD